MISKISNQSVRVLAVQTIAVVLLVIGVRQLFLIRDIDAIELANRYGVSEVAKHLQVKYGDAMSEKIASMMTRDAYATTLAIVVGCFLSAIIIWRSAVTRLLPIGLFLCSILISKSGFYHSRFVLAITNLPHYMFHLFSTEAMLGATGVLFIGVAVLVLFNKRLNGLLGMTSPVAAPS
ncbi:hypothetical protein [Hymenobacter daeguensis]